MTEYLIINGEAIAVDPKCNYRSPFADWEKTSGDYSVTLEDQHKYPALFKREVSKDYHYQWWIACSKFTTSGEQEHLDRMLSYVTLENPPLAPTPDIWMETESAGEDYRVGYVVTSVVMAAGIVVAGVAGGWPAALAVMAVLSTLFFISWMGSRLCIRRGDS